MGPLVGHSIAGLGPLVVHALQQCSNLLFTRLQLPLLNLLYGSSWREVLYGWLRLAALGRYDLAAVAGFGFEEGLEAEDWSVRPKVHSWEEWSDARQFVHMRPGSPPLLPRTVAAIREGLSSAHELELPAAFCWRNRRS